MKQRLLICRCGIYYVRTKFIIGSADKISRKTCVMKIHLRQFLLLKQIILLAVPVIILLAIVLYFFLPGRLSVTAKDKVELQNRTASQVIPKARPAAPLAKVRVIKPVRVADEPFKGYYPIPMDDAETDENRDKSAAQTGETEAPCEELSAPAVGAGKAAKGHIQADKKTDKLVDKRGDAADSARSSQPVAGHKGSSVKETGQDSKTAEEAEVFRHIEERAIEAGIPEAGRKKLIQSYQELSKVLPRKEAEKMIIWKIVHEYKQ